MDRGKDPLLFPNTYTPSSSTAHLQYYQRCESLIFKIWGKLNLLCDNQIIKTEKKDKKIHIFQVLSSFQKRTAIVNLKKFSSNTIFITIIYTFGKFYVAKFNDFSERPNNAKEMFWNIFDWPLCWWYWK